MTISAITTSWEPDVGEWIDFANLTCDLCDATYPPDGNRFEYPLVVFQARDAGWQVMRPPGRAVCCHDCHQRVFDDQAAS